MRLSDFDGRYYQVLADGEFEVIANAASAPDRDAFFFIEDNSYVARVLSKENVACILCKKEHIESVRKIRNDIGIAVSDNPRASMYELHNWLAQNETGYVNVFGKTQIGENCNIDKTVIIPDYGVVIGNGVEIGPYTVLHQGVVIGDYVRIMANSIIGGENFIPFYNREGNRTQLVQLGRLIISDYVQIGYNTYVMRGTFPFDATKIGKYTMIESGVEVSHNSVIGDNCVLHGQCHVCGNTVVESNVRIGPKSIISNRKHVGNKAEIDIGSVVVSDVKKGQRVAGNWAIDHDKFLRWHMRKLRKM